MFRMRQSRIYCQRCMKHTLVDIKYQGTLRIKSGQGELICTNCGNHIPFTFEDEGGINIDY